MDGIDNRLVGGKSESRFEAEKVIGFILFAERVAIVEHEIDVRVVFATEQGSVVC